MKATRSSTKKRSVRKSSKKGNIVSSLQKSYLESLENDNFDDGAQGDVLDDLISDSDIEDVKEVDRTKQQGKESKGSVVGKKWFHYNKDKVLNDKLVEMRGQLKDNKIQWSSKSVLKSSQDDKSTGDGDMSQKRKKGRPKKHKDTGEGVSKVGKSHRTVKTKFLKRKFNQVLKYELSKYEPSVYVVENQYKRNEGEHQGDGKEENTLEKMEQRFGTYESAQAPPSKRPKRYFCTICGNISFYTCPLFSSRICSAECYDKLQMMRGMKQG